MPLQELHKDRTSWGQNCFVDFNVLTIFTSQGYIREIFVIPQCFERECDVFLEVVPLKTQLLWGTHYPKNLNPDFVFYVLSVVCDYWGALSEDGPLAILDNVQSSTYKVLIIWSKAAICEKAGVPAGVVNVIPCRWLWLSMSLTSSSSSLSSWSLSMSLTNSFKSYLYLCICLTSNNKLWESPKLSTFHPFMKKPWKLILFWNTAERRWQRLGKRCVRCRLNKQSCSKYRVRRKFSEPYFDRI